MMRTIAPNLLVFALTLVLTAAFPPRAAAAPADQIPDLTADQRAALDAHADAAPLDENPAFLALRNNLSEWTVPVRAIVADRGLRAYFLENALDNRAIAQLGAAVLAGDAPRGRAVPLIGRFVTKTAVPRVANMELWLVRPVTPDTLAATPTAVLLADPTVDATNPAPEEGDLVFALARYLGEIEPAADRSRTIPSRQVAFVGAVLDVDDNLGEPAADTIVWFALAIAVLIAIGIVVFLFVVRAIRAPGSKPDGDAPTGDPGP